MSKNIAIKEIKEMTKNELKIELKIELIELFIKLPNKMI